MLAAKKQVHLLDAQAIVLDYVRDVQELVLVVVLVLVQDLVQVAQEVAQVIVKVALVVVQDALVYVGAVVDSVVEVVADGRDYNI